MTAVRTDHYSCPVCKRRATEEAPPITRRLRNGASVVAALRRRCVGCGYTDRTSAFRGGLSLTWDEGGRDIAGRRLKYGEEVED
jgi:hypothetical protein